MSKIQQSENTSRFNSLNRTQQKELVILGYYNRGKENIEKSKNILDSYLVQEPLQEPLQEPVQEPVQELVYLPKRTKRRKRHK
jgi:hypothetical protein